MKMAGPSAKQEREWRAQSDLDALRTVSEMRKDKKRMAAVRELVKRERDALDNVDPDGND